MKRKNRLMILTLASLSMLGLSGCKNKDIQVTDLTSNTESTTVVDDQIMEVYQAYKANGGTLDYDAWLASIKGEKGEKGDKGDPGTPGTPGNPGEPGTPGADGKSMLTGTADPEATLGNDGDVYLNSDTFDLFKKEDGAWVRIGNIKGADGDKGVDGSNGQQGDKGDKGDTAYGCTILPCEGGHVELKIGSAVVGDPIEFTFVPDDGYTLDYFYVNGMRYEASACLPDGNRYHYSTVMVENGFVIQGVFKKQVFIKDVNEFKALVENPTSESAKLGGDIDLTTISLDTETSFTGEKTLDIDLNGHTIKTGEAESNRIVPEDFFKLTLRNGKITTESEKQPITAWHSSIILNDIEITSAGYGIVANDGYVETNRVDILSGYQALSTNNSFEPSYFRINDSDIESLSQASVFIANDSMVEIVNSTVSGNTGIDMRLGYLKLTSSIVETTEDSQHVLTRDEAIIADGPYGESGRDAFEGEGVALSIRANFYYDSNEKKNPLSIDISNDTVFHGPIAVYDMKTSGASAVFNAGGTVKEGISSDVLDQLEQNGLYDFLHRDGLTRYVVDQQSVTVYKEVIAE